MYTYARCSRLLSRRAPMIDRKEEKKKEITRKKMLNRFVPIIGWYRLALRRTLEKSEERVRERGKGIAKHTRVSFIGRQDEREYK